MPAYVTTAKEFFQGAVPGSAARFPPLGELKGVVEFDIEGAEGGTWFLDLSTGKVSQTPSRPDCIVRAREGDFMALVEGRMSVTDGLITDRLKITGEASRLVRLFEALAAMRRN